MIPYRGSAEHFNRTVFRRRAAVDWLLCEEGNSAIISWLRRGLSWGRYTLLQSVGLLKFTATARRLAAVK